MPPPPPPPPPPVVAPDSGAITTERKSPLTSGLPVSDSLQSELPNPHTTYDHPSTEASHDAQYHYSGDEPFSPAPNPGNSHVSFYPQAILPVFNPRAFERRPLGRSFVAHDPFRLRRHVMSCADSDNLTFDDINIAPTTWAPTSENLGQLMRPPYPPEVNPGDNSPNAIPTSNFSPPSTVAPYCESPHAYQIAELDPVDSPTHGIWKFVRWPLFWQRKEPSYHKTAAPSVFSTTSEEESKNKREAAWFFITRILPSQIYLHLLLRLPSLYFSRVARIFEEADLTLAELKEVAIDTMLRDNGSFADTLVQQSEPFESSGRSKSSLPSQREKLSLAWKSFIDSVIREWETFNIISVLLLPAILTVLQLSGASDDPLTRYTALFSLMCALISLLFGCTYTIRFDGMRKTYKAAEWALEAKKTAIMWNVWVLLAMPVVWLAWSIILYVICVMSFVWRTSCQDTGPPPANLSESGLLAVRLVISTILGLGLVYGVLIMNTFRRYGEKMDKKWQERIQKWIDEEKALYPSYPSPQTSEGPYTTPTAPQDQAPHGINTSQLHLAVRTSVPSHASKSPSNCGAPPHSTFAPFSNNFLYLPAGDTTRGLRSYRYDPQQSQPSPPRIPAYTTSQPSTIHSATEANAYELFRVGSPTSDGGASCSSNQRLLDSNAPEGGWTAN